MRRLLPLLLSVPLLAAPVGAQQTLLVPPLTDVRVESPTFRGVGAAVNATPAALVLFPPERREALSIPFASISLLEVRRPNSSRSGAIRGAKYGALVGAAVFAVYAGVSLIFPDQQAFENVNYAATGALLLVGGAGVGAGYGAYQPGSHWEEVRPPSRLRVERDR